MLQAFVIQQAYRAGRIQHIDALVRSEDDVAGRVRTDRADGHDVQSGVLSVVGHLIVRGHLHKDAHIGADPQVAVLRDAEAHHTVDAGEPFESPAVIPHQAAVTARIDKAVRRLRDRHIAQKRQARVDVEDAVIVLGLEAHLVPARGAVGEYRPGDSGKTRHQE